MQHLFCCTDAYFKCFVHLIHLTSTDAADISEQSLLVQRPKLLQHDGGFTLQTALSSVQRYMGRQAAAFDAAGDCCHDNCGTVAISGNLQRRMCGSTVQYQVSNDPAALRSVTVRLPKDTFGGIDFQLAKQVEQDVLVALDTFRR